MSCPVLAARPGRLAGRRGQRGSGSVLLLAAASIVVAAAWAVLVLGVAVSARHRAAAAADLAALAGAGALSSGSGCTAAAAVATANGAVLRRCEVAGQVLEVAVGVRLPVVAGFLADPVRRARAGPGQPG